MKKYSFTLAFFVSVLLAVPAWAAEYDYYNQHEGSFENWNTWTNNYTGTQTAMKIRMGFNEATSLWTPTITLNNSSAAYSCGGIVVSWHKLTGATLVIENGKLTSVGDVMVGVGNSWAGGSSTNKITHGTMTIKSGGTLVINNNKGVYLGRPESGTGTDSEGTLNVNGGTITAGTGTWNLGHTPDSTYSTKGTLNITNGGTVTTSNATISLGQGGKNASGYITVDGTGSKLTVGTLNIGAVAGGTGKVTISNGGAISYTGLNIGTADGATGTLEIDNSSFTASTLNLGTVAGGTAKVVISNGGKLSFTGLNLGTTVGATGTLEINNASFDYKKTFTYATNGTGSIVISGKDSVVNLASLHLGTAKGSNGTLEVNGGTVNILNLNTGSGQTASVTEFSKGGDATFRITGGTVNHYGQIYTGEGAYNADLTVLYDFSGGVFNHVGNTFDYTKGTPTAAQFQTIGGGRFCMASHANGLMQISGTAEVNINAEFILTWQDYSGTIEQSGGTANIWGGIRADVTTGKNLWGLSRYGIVFANNGSTSGAGTYKLSGGTLNTYRLSSCNNTTDTNFVVSGGTANIKYDSSKGSSGQIEVATQQSGGTVTANIITYTNGGNWNTSNDVYGYSLSEANAKVPSVLNAERLYLNNNNKTDKTVTFKQTGGTSTFAKFTTGSAGDPAQGTTPIQLEKGAAFALSGGTSNWNTSSQILTGSDVSISGGTLNITAAQTINGASTLNVSGGAMNVSAAQTVSGTDTEINLSGGTTTYTNYLYVGNDASLNLSGDAVLVSAWGTVRSQYNTLQIGNAGTGSLSITENAKAYISGLSIGTTVGTTGNVTVDGANAVLNLVNSATKTAEVATQTYFGDKGICNIDLKNGGTLNNYGEIFSSERDNQSQVTINIDGGTFHHYGYDNTRESGVEGLLDSAMYGGGRFCLSSRGQNSINLNSGEFISEGEFILVWSHDNSASGTFNQTGGTATFCHNGKTTGVRNSIAGGVASNFGAAINFAGDGAATGTATYNLSGGTMTADSMARGNTSVKAQFNISGTGVANVGTLAVNTLMTGGTLSATTVNIPTSTNSDWAYATTFYQTGGALSPALDEIGTMTFQTPYSASGNVTYVIDYDPTTETNDQIAFSSTADLTGVNLFFEINMNEAELTGTETIDLAIFSGTKPTGMNSISGVLTNYLKSNPEVVYSLDFSKLASNGTLTISTGLPEPATWILLVTGLVLMAGNKRNFFGKNESE